MVEKIRKDKGTGTIGTAEVEGKGYKKAANEDKIRTLELKLEDLKEKIEKIESGSYPSLDAVTNPKRALDHLRAEYATTYKELASLRGEDARDVFIP